MKKTWNEALICEFLSAMEEIPAGIIASYVRIARLIGRDRYARPVGKALHMASFYGSFPYMNRKGRHIPHFRSPRKVRPPESVIFLPDGSVDVKNISGTAEASPNIEEMHRSSKQGAFLLVDIGSILLR